MSRDFTAIWVAYLMATIVAIGVGLLAPVEHPIATAALASLAAIGVLFIHSFAFGNSSFVDAFWSVAPAVIGVYWIASAGDGLASTARQVVVLALVLWWGAGLTWNWARGWDGLAHEDWRYVDLRESTGRLYWAVSLLGIHLLPACWLFLGCLPLYPALAVGTRPWGWLDGLACLVTVSAIACEQLADRQLHRFRSSRPEPEAILDTGLWSLSRHPNYLGEMGLWWGLFLFGLAAAPAYWWTGIGAASITLMFRYVSLPMIETRMLGRRPAFAERQRQVGMVLPGLGKRA